MSQNVHGDRRRIVAASMAGLGLAALGVFPRSWAAALAATPTQSRGPFYPLKLPLDRDNDLVHVAGRSGIAEGEITDIVGQVRDERGRVVAGALIEIWQANAHGRYHHPWDRQDQPLDPNFQGYGRTLTDSAGHYRFRTIRPVAYPGRAPHIHFSIGGSGVAPLVTQMYVAGAPENSWDGLLNGIRDADMRSRLIVPLTAAPAEAGVQWVGRFDIVLPSAGGREG